MQAPLVTTGCSTTATALHPFNGLFSRTTWYQRGKTNLDVNKARDDGILGCSGISWTICKPSAPHSRQMTTPTPHQSIFTGRMLFLMPNQQCQSTEGINWLHCSTNSERPRRCCHLQNNFGSCQIFPIREMQPKLLLPLGNLGLIHGSLGPDPKWYLD